MESRVLYVMVFWTMTISTASTNDNDWTTQCNDCKCVWAKGKKTANCTNLQLSDIPRNLSSEIREIDFSNNPLHYLAKEVMVRAELKDIHKLRFANCNVSNVDEKAFKGLALLIELDLSSNLISILKPKTFRDNMKMRVLILNFNKLKRLDAGLFYNMTHLQKVFLGNNEIFFIDKSAFDMLEALQHLELSNNMLTTMPSEFLNRFPKIVSLDLEGNPWNCDCQLQEFRSRTIENNLITTPTGCAEPRQLRHRLWKEDIVFACIPQIIEPLPSTHIEATTTNVTLTCRVLGDPQPDVEWVSNGKIIEKDPRQNTHRFIISKSKVGNYTWNNLTITNVNYRDKGDYKCVAKNPGGVDEKNISLIVSSISGIGGGGVLVFSTNIPIFIALTVGAIIILIMVFVLVCCCCRKNTHGLAAKRRDNSSDECIRLHHGQSDAEKTIITSVNPVIKPPRSSIPPSITSGGTEVSDVKKNLLGSESNFAGDDESSDFDLYSRKSYVDPDYRHHPYPPDLLSFPPRMYQVSPAASSASTVADTTRLPPHHGPQSPLSSPIYDTVSLYRTLPYSRSHSPFVGGPTRIPRQGGYVTIPRRPRTRLPTETSTDGEEPMYDNLGVRTGVDGSSALSLNKMGVKTTPKSPLSPCDTIVEYEPNKFTQWARDNADALRTPDGKKIAPVPPPKPKKRTSTGPLFEDEGEDGTEV